VEEVYESLDCGSPEEIKTPGNERMCFRCVSTSGLKHGQGATSSVEIPRPSTGIHGSLWCVSIFTGLSTDCCAQSGGGITPLARAYNSLALEL